MNIKALIYNFFFQFNATFDENSSKLRILKQRILTICIIFSSLLFYSFKHYNATIARQVNIVIHGKNIVDACNSILYLISFLLLNIILSVFIYFCFLFFYLALKFENKNSLIHQIFIPKKDLSISHYARDNKSAKIIWFIVGLLFLFASITFLESKQPFFFTQDDNYQQFLPTLIQSCRSFFQGIFPTWNPYQQLGSPTFNVGVYALSYPLTYFSYFLAHFIFKNDFLIIEIFSIIHLFLGYISTWLLLKRIGFISFLSTLGSLCFILSGFFLIVGRSWYYMIPTAVWLPLMILSILSLKTTYNYSKWLLYTGLIIGLYFHSGNIQMWTYGMMFFFIVLFFLIFSKQLYLKKALLVVPALLLGLSIAAPLLFPMMKAMSNTFRVVSSGSYGNIAHGFFAMIFPYPIATANGSFASWTNIHSELIGHIYYSGTFFTLLGFSALFFLSGALIIFKGTFLGKKLITENIWLFCAGVAFIFAIGKYGIIWTIVSNLPIFNKFQIPLKFLPFVTLFLIMGGGTIFMRFLSITNFPQYYKIGSIFFIFVALVYHIALPLPSFYTYKSIPYPSVPKQLTIPLDDTNSMSNRIIPFLPMYEKDISLRSNLLMFWNFSSIYSINSLDGYDPLVESTPETNNMKKRILNDPLNAVREYGVRWILIQNEDSAYNPLKRGVGLVESTMSGQLWMKILLAHAKKRLTLPHASIWELDNFSPMAFQSDKPIKAFKYSFSGNAMSIYTSKFTDLGGSLTANVLWRPDMIVADDQNRVLNTKPDFWGRIRIDIPYSTSFIKIKYEPPIAFGFYLAIILFLIALLSYYRIVFFLKSS